MDKDKLEVKKKYCQLLYDFIMIDEYRRIYVRKENKTFEKISKIEIK